MSSRKKNGITPTIDAQEIEDAAARLEEAAEAELAATVNVAVETLSGDMRDFILDRLRFEQSQRPWHERSEADQRDTVARVESHVQDVLRRAVELIAARGLRTIKATLEQVTIKDGIVGKIIMSKFDEQRHALVDATGSKILIVVADPEEFTGERAPAEIKPDQSELLEKVGVVHSEPDGVMSPLN